VTLLELSQMHEVCMWLESTADRDKAFRAQHHEMAGQLRRILMSEYLALMDPRPRAACDPVAQERAT
jgi:hypothetical protein